LSFSSSPPPVVVDASAAIEFVTGNQEWLATFGEWADSERTLLAPDTFLAEIASGLMLGHARLPASDARQRLNLVIGTGVETSGRGLSGLFDAMDLAQQHGLTVYDALYLQLALDVDGELATLDTRLRSAAEAEEVALTR
jgi:predicted nucleic acid-binding protein